MRPSASSLSAPSRTLFIAELASCIRINPKGLICGKNRRTSCSRSGTSLSQNSMSMRPSTFISRLDSLRASIHLPSPDSVNRFFAAS